MKARIGIVSLTLACCFTASSYAQLGRLKDLKEKATKLSVQKKGPLKAEEIGKLEYNVPKLQIGESDLALKISLPKPPKYYAMRWCASSSCDYDHGEMFFLVELDGEILAHFDHTFWNDDYETKTEFQLLLLPKTDGNIKEDGVFPGLPAVTKRGEVYMPMLDMVYGPLLKEGTHKLRVRMFNPQNSPKDMTYELGNPEYFNAWDPVIDQIVEFEVTEAGRKKMKDAASLEKPVTRKGGEWTAMEELLLSKSEKYPEGKCLRLVSSSDWTINRNAFGIILNRTSYVQIIFENKWGCRVTYNKVTEQYDGSSYGKPKMGNMHGTIKTPPHMLVELTNDKPIPCEKANE
ncbi:MAG: hypothetical protein EP338_04270 [Bacteroidetes bacterium]|nr:MAG: hypothetical protein EP338_04270 [Bacteroidota bacterium]